MKIVGIDGLTVDQLNEELRNGARFVIYQYCISIVVMTFKRPSNIHFIPSGHSAVGRGVPFTMLSLVLGWWGIPWGPIHTIGSLATNFQGGKDVTREVVSSLGRRAVPA